MKKLQFILNKSRNVKLTAYLNKSEYNRPAMLILPGGGYVVCAPREMEPPALEFVEANYQVFVLEYTIGNDCKWPVPIEDFDMAMDFILNHAKDWSINPNKIVVCGFSAGGHIAACAISIAKHKPAAALLIYPAILDNILKLLKDDFPEATSLVNKNTSPCFIAAARDDRTVAIDNSIKMALALAQYDVAFESHIYSYGGHAFSTGKPSDLQYPASNRLQNWIPDAIGWLEEIIGKATPNGFKENNIDKWCSADNAPCLSLMCSLGHILDFINKLEVPASDKAAAKNYIQPITDALEQFASNQNIKVEAAQISYLGNNLREICDALNIPIDTARKIHYNLRTIENSH